MNTKMNLSSNVKILLFTIVAFIIPLPAQAGEVTYGDNTYSTGDTLTASGLNAKFNEIKGNVNDNHSRVQALENKSPDVGRIVVSVNGVSANGVLNSDNTATLPDAVSSTAYGGNFTRPTDYVSGDITIKAIIKDCADSFIAYELFNPKVRGVNIGENTSFNIVTKICLSGLCPTVEIPPTTSSGLSTTWHTVEVNSTITGFSDINYPYFARRGGDVNDTCTGDLTVIGFIVEYPRG